MACNPFDPWGGEGKNPTDLTDEIMEESYLCGLGEEAMLGFQCSCSS